MSKIIIISDPGDEVKSITATQNKGWNPPQGKVTTTYPDNNFLGVEQHHKHILKEYNKIFIILYGKYI